MRDSHGNLTHVRVTHELDTPCSLEALRAFVDSLPSDLIDLEVGAWQDTDRDGDRLDEGAIEFSGWRPATDEDREKDERQRAAVQAHLERRKQEDESRKKADAARRLREIKRDFPDLLK
jgi:hypothetical protein